ncbi:hypothetical protein PCO31110_01864 [Pandoraea communis]|uniref:Outer membrane porin, OprD family n=1 Tax=Pandoraea communis TaxID=2508297 RepID=A0A5E4U6B1_9BURK|nr:hypothetical protein [Pandoraea communis]VVD95590.1 hypothetical protein PCO31110_01864 [Pandoraea communis]
MNVKSEATLRRTMFPWLATALIVAPTLASAQVLETWQPPEASSLAGLFTQGHVSGDVRAFYYGAHNAFYNKGLNQNTINYGGGLTLQSASLYGISFGVSAYASRPLLHPSDSSRVDGSLGPSFTTLGEAYVQYRKSLFTATAGNQSFDVPFISPYDYRIAPQLFQGVSGRYGTKDNYIEAFRMFRWKSWTSDSFTDRTAYNSDFDGGSTIGMKGTPGFYGAGGAGKQSFGAYGVDGQAWYVNYMNYARMFYADGHVSLNEGVLQPYAGIQVAYENGGDSNLLGRIRSQVYGFQVGVKHNSLNVSLGYDYTRPDANAYQNGSLVTPYAHNMSSGPFFAQPFITSTQDLGAGRAYGLSISGKPVDNLTLGTQYSFMDLVSTPGAPSLNQSEYLVYVMYNFQGKLKGFSIVDFFAYQSSPAKPAKFFQNRLQLQYAWGQ